jgi:hypothetical protein
MKPLIAYVTVALLSLGVTACGDTSTPTRLTHSGASTAPAAAASVAAANRAAPDLRDLKGDEDDDDTPAGYTGSSKYDNDADFDNDYKKENNGYYDNDDASVLDYGHAADAAELKTVTGIVERYYKAAAADDGAEACSMIQPSLAKSLPEDYGQAPGPAYLRGARTCQAVMSLVFKYRRSLVSGSIRVTAVRVESDKALALLGSKTMPASDMPLERERGSWTVSSLLDSPLP